MSDGKVNDELCKSKLELMREIVQFHCSSAREVSSVVGSILTIKAELKLESVELEDNFVINAIAVALPADYELVVNNWLATSCREERNLEQFLTIVNEKTRVLLEERDSFISTSADQIRKTCNYCKNIGHWKKDCRKLKWHLDRLSQCGNGSNDESSKLRQITRDASKIQKSTILTDSPRIQEKSSEEIMKVHSRNKKGVSWDPSKPKFID